MIIVRRMEEADAGRAALLEKACFTEPWPEHAFLESLSLAYAYYCVAEEAGEIIGICGLRNIAGEGEITNVAVDEGHRRRGVAAMLLVHIFGEGARMGAASFTLEVRAGNMPAIGLYEKYGFRSEGVRRGFYTNPPEDALVMWKR